MKPYQHLHQQQNYSASYSIISGTTAAVSAKTVATTQTIVTVKKAKTASTIAEAETAAAAETAATIPASTLTKSPTQIHN